MHNPEISTAAQAVCVDKEMAQTRSCCSLLFTSLCASGAALTNSLIERLFLPRAVIAKPPFAQFTLSPDLNSKKMPFQCFREASPLSSLKVHILIAFLTDWRQF